MSVVALFKTITAAKHCSKIVRSSTKHSAVNSNLFFRIKNKYYVIKIVKISAFQHVAKNFFTKLAIPIFR